MRKCQKSLWYDNGPGRRRNKQKRRKDGRSRIDRQRIFPERHIFLFFLLFYFCLLLVLVLFFTVVSVVIVVISYQASSEEGLADIEPIRGCCWNEAQQQRSPFSSSRGCHTITPSSYDGVTYSLVLTFACTLRSQMHRRISSHIASCTATT